MRLRGDKGYVAPSLIASAMALALAGWLLGYPESSARGADVPVTAPSIAATPGNPVTASASPADTSVAPPAKPSGDKNASPFSAFSLSPGKGPIKIASDNLSLDYKGKTVVFTGHVRAEQSGTQLASNTLTLTYGDSNFHDLKSIVAGGDVRIAQGGRVATGDHAVLDQVAQTVVMTGNPVVRDGDNEISGDKITVYLDSGRSVVEGARATVFPRAGETRDNEGSPDKAVNSK